MEIVFHTQGRKEFCDFSFFGSNRPKGVSAVRIQSSPKTKRIERSHWEKTVKELKRASDVSQHYFKAILVEAHGSIQGKIDFHI